MWLRINQCERPLDFLFKRVSRLSGIPVEHFESLQVVRYNGNGEKFDLHTDHLDHFNDLECYGRLATCLFYLNSAKSEGEESGGVVKEGFEGGSTNFPEYGHVKPRKGSAIFWFNTVERPSFNEFSKNTYLNVNFRSRHSGEPVFGSEKWICNAWIHPVPFPKS